MSQQGQVFPQRSKGAGGAPLWGYRYRLGGRDAARVRKGGYLSEQDAREALERALERVPLQEIALDALAQVPTGAPTDLVLSAARGGHFDLHNFRRRAWMPAQRAAGITPLRRVYDLRHTFATFALRAGISTFDLSCYMGASLTMIDRQRNGARFSR